MTVTREPYPVPAWKRSVPGEFKKSWENKGRGNSPSQFLMDVCGKKNQENCPRGREGEYVNLLMIKKRLFADRYG